MNKRLKLFIPGVFFLLMLGLLLFGLGRDPNQVPSALVNRPLPDFNLPELFDTGRMVSPDDFSGSVAIINVWGSWCPPCHAEHPYLMELSERESDITFIGVNYKERDSQDGRNFILEKGNPFDLIVVDLSGRLGIDLGVTGAPETFIVDSSGMIRYRHVGEINHRIWENTFRPILAQID